MHARATCTTNHPCSLPRRKFDALTAMLTETPIAPASGNTGPRECPGLQLLCTFSSHVNCRWHAARALQTAGRAWHWRFLSVMSNTLLLKLPPVTRKLSDTPATRQLRLGRTHLQRASEDRHGCAELRSSANMAGEGLQRGLGALLGRGFAPCSPTPLARACAAG